MPRFSKFHHKIYHHCVSFCYRNARAYSAFQFNSNNEDNKKYQSKSKCALVNRETENSVKNWVNIPTNDGFISIFGFILVGELNHPIFIFVFQPRRTAPTSSLHFITIFVAALSIV